MEYTDFLATKRHPFTAVGIDVTDTSVSPVLFPFQRDIVRWAVRKGRCAIFADTGLGKTLILLEWARLLGQKTLIVAPLSVARQTVRMARAMLFLDVHFVRSNAEARDGMNITNYEMADHFDPSAFGAVVLDESSILKAFDGKRRKLLTRMFAETPYRLCCTATPAPNDSVELGNHAEFLGVCTEAEMKALFFINANKEHTFVDDAGIPWRKKGSNAAGQEWRLKHHAEEPFFEWLSSWAICMTKPSDLGYDDDGFNLPPLNIVTHFVHVDYVPEDQLMFTHLSGIGMRAEVRRDTIGAKLAIVQNLVDGNDAQWIVWTGLDAESGAVSECLSGAIEVKGTDDPEHKVRAFEDFQDGKVRVLVTKPRIGGFGMNFQNAHNMVFFGLNDSWEGWYQSIRREYRFGQTETVNVHIILSDVETEIWENVKRKDAMAERLRRQLIEHMRQYERNELHMTRESAEAMPTRTEHGAMWLAMNGDSCELLAEIPDSSIDLSVYSPPFADLFTYTDSPRDLGNSRDWAEFFEHYRFIIQEILRVTKPGRLTCVHTSDIPAMASRDGYIGVRDFPGEVIRAYEAEGWTFIGRAFVSKNPQAQAIRVKSKALLFVQLRKDSADSRPALVDQILLFKKDGENAVPVRPVENGEIDNETWIEWANGIWLGIPETETLQYHGARGQDDEKHICPLQLQTIERCIKLYSNPGETVLTPFGGIGSEGYQAVRYGRKAILIELKRDYYDTLVQNMRNAEAKYHGEDLFSWAERQSVPVETLA